MVDDFESDGCLFKKKFQHFVGEIEEKHEDLRVACLRTKNRTSIV